MSKVTNAVKDYFSGFTALLKLPREFAVTQLLNFLDCTAYFSMVTVITLYLTYNIGFDDIWAGAIIGGWTLTISIIVFFIGFFIDAVGIKRAFLIGIALLVIGRGGLYLTEANEGMKVEAGFISGKVIDNQELSKIYRIGNPYVLTIDEKLSSMKEIAEVMNKIGFSDRVAKRIMQIEKLKSKDHQRALDLLFNNTRCEIMLLKLDKSFTDLNENNSDSNRPTFADLVGIKYNIDENPRLAEENRNKLLRNLLVKELNIIDIKDGIPSKIKADDFEDNVLDRLNNEDDKKIFETNYKLNENDDYYYLNENIEKNIKNKISEKLDKSGFAMSFFYKLAEETYLNKINDTDKLEKLAGDKEKDKVKRLQLYFKEIIRPLVIVAKDIDESLYEEIGKYNIDHSFNIMPVNLSKLTIYKDKHKEILNDLALLTGSEVYNYEAFKATLNKKIGDMKLGNLREVGIRDTYAIFHDGFGDKNTAFERISKLTNELNTVSLSESEKEFIKYRISLLKAGLSEDTYFKIFGTNFSMPMITSILLLLLMAFGTAAIGPAIMAGIKRYTTKETRSTGFNMWYLVMNVAAIVGALLVDAVRLPFDDPNTGNEIIFLLGFIFSLVIWLSIFFFLRKGIDADELLKKKHAKEVQDAHDEAERKAGHVVEERKEKVKETAQLLNPFKIAAEVLRLPIFWKIFLLAAITIGVKLIFSHFFLVYPKYFTRVLGEDAYLGVLNAINPFLIVVGLILFTPVLIKFRVYSLIMVGTFISGISIWALAIPGKLLLPFGFDLVTSYYMLIFVQLFIFSIGEVIWSPKLSEYIAVMAPKGREGSFIGLAALPMFGAKFVNGVLSGFLLTTYCPDTRIVESNYGTVENWLLNVPYTDSVEFMWVILGLISLSSPLLIFLLKNFIEGAKDKAVKEKEELEKLEDANSAQA